MLPTAVRELVTAELDQSRVIAPLPRQLITNVMQEAGMPDTAPLTNALARELAVRSSVRTVLSGSVLPIAAGRYSIVLRVTDADSGRTLLTVTREAVDRDLVPAVQAAARLVRRGLGERRDAIAANTPLVRAATPSFAAYRKYVEAIALSEQGEAVASNGVLHEALALDTGFASAWATIASNYQTMRNLDSAALALAEALRRPARLSGAQLYRLRADSAYALGYDISGAVRWYDLLLQISPQSISGHNNRAVLLYSLGRYDEALAGFRRTEELEPFGTAQAQIEIFNQTMTLLALGRVAEATATVPKLRGRFAEYSAELLATYRGQWSVAESLAAKLAVDPSTPSWLKTPAITMLAGSSAAQGEVAAADGQLRIAAAAAADGSARHWYSNALLLLAAAAGRAPGRVPSWLLADTTAGGLLSGGLWAAIARDTATAEKRLRILQQRSETQQRRLGPGLTLLRAYTLAAEGRWNQVAEHLRAAALTGEPDGGDLDQVSSMALRWLMAEAYERTGKPDSAEAMYELVLDPTRTPFSHLALRGLVHSFASRRLALLQRAGGRPDA
jgi:tetratricopeptide (TPR) repeat protein